MKYMTFDEMTISTVSEHIAKIKRQIEVNLFNVHNMFSENKFDKIKSIYDGLKFGVTSEKNKSIMKPFIEIYRNFIGLDYCYDIETEDVLSQYQEIEQKLKEAIKGLV